MSLYHKNRTVEQLQYDAKRQCKRIYSAWPELPIELLIDIIERELLLPAELLSIMTVCKPWKFAVERSRGRIFWKGLFHAGILSLKIHFKESLPFIMLYCLQQNEQCMKKWAYDIAYLIKNRQELLLHYYDDSDYLLSEAQLTVFYSKQHGCENVLTESMPVYTWKKYVNVIFKELSLQLNLNEDSFHPYYKPAFFASQIITAIKTNCASVVSCFLKHKIFNDCIIEYIKTAVRHNHTAIADLLCRSYNEHSSGDSLCWSCVDFFSQALCSPDPAAATAWVTQRFEQFEWKTVDIISQYVRDLHQKQQQYKKGYDFLKQELRRYGWEVTAYSNLDRRSRKNTIVFVHEADHMSSEERREVYNKLAFFDGRPFWYSVDRPIYIAGGLVLLQTTNTKL